MLEPRGRKYRFAPAIICQVYQLVDSPGCLQLLEILEFNWSSWKFCVRCRRLTALVSSHKNMDKYLWQKHEIYRHQMCSFKFQMHQNPFSAGALPRTSVGELMTLPQIPSRLGRAEIPILWVFRRRPKQGPGFFLKSFLESPGNLLEICLVKFVDTL